MQIYENEFSKKITAPSAALPVCPLPFAFSGIVYNRRLPDRFANEYKKSSKRVKNELSCYVSSRRMFAITVTSAAEFFSSAGK